MIQIKTQLVIVFFNQLAVKCKTCNMNEKRDGKVLFRGRWTAHHIYIYIYIWVQGLIPWLSLGKLGGLGE